MERGLREHELRVQAETDRARMAAIFQAAPDAIIFVDRATGHITANAQTSHLFARALLPEAGVQQCVGQICRPDGWPLTLDELLLSRALDGETTPREELLIVQPAGERIPVRASAAPVHGPAGQAIGAVAIFQDISALKQLEREREEWMSAVAHDLRQPVTAIKLLTSWFQSVPDGELKPERVNDRAEAILAATAQLNRLVNDLLEVSRLGAGQLALDRMNIDIGLLITSVSRRLVGDEQDGRVEVSIASDVPRVPADPGRLEQVLTNLLSNAMKYGYAGSQIRVHVACQPDEVVVGVVNRGEGIEPAEMARLFSRFYRTTGARKSGVEGIGLGLYVSRELVLAHGGRMWAESTPGETTTFWFTLPLAVASASQG
jgi:signal transduction histidine kinase